MTPSKAQRWLDLLSVLVGNRFPVSVEEIMEQVPAYRDRWIHGDRTSRASVRRMFERDKDEFRRMGIPLETRRYRVDGSAEAEGYLIQRRDFYLPYLELLPEEAADRGDPAEGPLGAPPPSSSRSPSRHAVGTVTLSEADAATALVALREVLSLPSFPFKGEARSALRKLTFDLDPVLAQGPAASPALRILDRPGGADPEGTLGVLLDGLYDRRRVRFRYRSIGRDAVESREVEPWGLLFQWGAWYLAARDPEKEGVRLFRLDRMEEAGPSTSKGSSPQFEVPADFDIRAYSGRKAWELGEAEDPGDEVQVRFLPPASLLAARNGWGEPVREEEDAAVRTFRVRRREPLLRWLLSLAGEAQVISPPDAVEEMRTLTRAVLARYRGPR